MIDLRFVYSAPCSKLAMGSDHLVHRNPQALSPVLQKSLESSYIDECSERSNETFQGVGVPDIAHFGVKCTGRTRDRQRKKVKRRNKTEIDKKRETKTRDGEGCYETAPCQISPSLSLSRELR